MTTEVTTEATTVAQAEIIAEYVQLCEQAQPQVMQWLHDVGLPTDDAAFNVEWFMVVRHLLQNRITLHGWSPANGDG